MHIFHLASYNFLFSTLGSRAGSASKKRPASQASNVSGRPGSAASQQSQVPGHTSADRPGSGRPRSGARSVVSQQQDDPGTLDPPYTQGSDDVEPSTERPHSGSQRPRSSGTSGSRASGVFVIISGSNTIGTLALKVSHSFFVTLPKLYYKYMHISYRISGITRLFCAF